MYVCMEGVGGGGRDELVVSLWKSVWKASMALLESSMVLVVGWWRFWELRDGRELGGEVWWGFGGDELHEPPHANVRDSASHQPQLVIAMRYQI